MNHINKWKKYTFETLCRLLNDAKTYWLLITENNPFWKLIHYNSPAFAFIAYCLVIYCQSNLRKKFKIINFEGTASL